MDQDLKCPKNEHIILNTWQLHLSPSLSSPFPGNTTKISPSHWEAPQVGYHKINFDGVSKGNLGLAGYGAVIHNSKGEILHISIGNLGHSTNNAAEIWGLLKGLQEAKEKGLNLLIAEDDSQIVINLLYHLLNGANLEKISPSWRLMNGMTRIKSFLQPQWVIHPSHIRRNENQVADMLENFGVDLHEGDFFCSSASYPTHPFMIACRNMAHNKDQPLDGVISDTTGGWPHEWTHGHISCHLEPTQPTLTSTINPCV
jgi:ribonuclease HI